MIWSLFMQLGRNMWSKDYPCLNFDDAVWDEVLSACNKHGINQIVLDIGEGLQYKCHPELSREGAWSHERAKAEVERCRELGIELIPKLNFSATHHLWLGEYGRMMSTSVYYKVCRELIEETYEAFDHPRFFHLGMDEEGGKQFIKTMELVHYRQGELIWHDLKFLIDTVKACGAKAMIWGDLSVYTPEEFRKHIPYDDVILQPWIYFGIRREHWSLVESKQGWRDWAAFEELPHIKYIEEAPIWQKMPKEGARAMNDGYLTMPAPSIWGGNDWCHDDVVEYFVNNNESGKLLGFMTTPWVSTSTNTYNYYGDTSKTCRDYILKSIELLAEARDKFCK